VAAIAAVAVFGSLGLILDAGRMYAVRSEGQLYTDSAAIAAALELDGTRNGMVRADAVVAANTNRWDLNKTAFSGTVTEYSTAVGGPWNGSATAPLNSQYVRVTAASNVALYVMPIVAHRDAATVRARSIAGQVPKTSFKEGLFPFSPFAHSTTPPNFGLVPGQVYTLRWPSNPKLPNGGNSGNICPGDRTQALVNMAQAAGGSERGYIEDTSASIIRATIVEDYQSVTRTIGDLVDLTGGAKQSQLDSLNARILQDTDHQSSTFSEYQSRGEGNGRRIVGVPINDGGTPMGVNHRIVSIGAFFLYPTGDYGNGGNQAWCGEYIGSWVQGADHQGAAGAGAFVVRLVE
jgi:hypothetical protein